MKKQSLIFLLALLFLLFALMNVARPAPAEQQPSGKSTYAAPIPTR